MDILFLKIRVGLLEAFVLDSQQKRDGYIDVVNKIREELESTDQGLHDLDLVKEFFEEHLQSVSDLSLPKL